MTRLGRHLTWNGLQENRLAFWLALQLHNVVGVIRMKDVRAMPRVSAESALLPDALERLSDVRIAKVCQDCDALVTGEQNPHERACGPQMRKAVASSQLSVASRKRRRDES